MIRRHNGSYLLTPVIFMLVVWLVTCFSSSTFAKEEDKKKDLPERGISVTPEYTGVMISEEEGVSIDLIVTNQGRRDENISLSVTSIPKGWKAWIKTYNFGVTGVHVKSDTSKNLTLRAEPGDDTGPGQYTFGIQAHTEDGKLTSTGQIVITVKKEKKKKKQGHQNHHILPGAQGPHRRCI